MSPLSQSYKYLLLFISSFQIIVVEPDTGKIKCSYKLNAQGITSMAFGEYPNEKTGKLTKCIYATTQSLAEELADEGETDKPADGQTLVIQDVDDFGPAAGEVDFALVFNKESCP